jgi:hypothetical protein
VRPVLAVQRLSPFRSRNPEAAVGQLRDRPVADVQRSAVNDGSAALPVIECRAATSAAGHKLPVEWRSPLRTLRVVAVQSTAHGVARRAWITTYPCQPRRLRGEPAIAGNGACQALRNASADSMEMTNRQPSRIDTGQSRLIAQPQGAQGPRGPYTNDNADSNCQENHPCDLCHPRSLDK